LLLNKLETFTYVILFIIIQEINNM